MHAWAGYKLSVLLGGPILASICLFAKFVPPRGTIFGKGGPILAAKTGPGGPILADKIGPGEPLLAIFLPKSVRGDQFWRDRASQNDVKRSLPCVPPSHWTEVLTI